MFTGIIETLGSISSVQPFKGGKELRINTELAAELQIDDSIATNGVCLTVVEKTDKEIVVQAVQETLSKTTIGALKMGDPVNLERSLTPQTRMDGHIVQGHVDTTGKIKSFINNGAEWLLTIEFPEQFADLIVGRGSIAVEGISLTVARERRHECTIAIIPYTYEHTNLKSRKAGDLVNLEFDILGKYVQRFLNNRSEGSTEAGGLTLESLVRAGIAKG